MDATATCLATVASRTQTYRSQVKIKRERRIIVRKIKAASEYLRLNKEDILVLTDSDIAFQRVSIQRAVEGAKQLGEAGVPLLWAIAGLYASSSPISFFYEHGARAII